MREEITAPFSELVEKITSDSPVSLIGGLWGSSRALFLACLSAKTDRPVVAITPTDEAAELLITDLRLFCSWFKDPPPLYSIPFWEILPYDTIPPHPDIIHRRMSAYQALLANRRGIYVIPVHSIMQRPMSSHDVKDSIIEIKTDETIDMDHLISRLVSSGYEPSDLVVNRGFFSLRGGILDLFSPGQDFPVRIEFFGDHIESIRSFDQETQRSVQMLESSAILPAQENPSFKCTFFDYLSDDVIIIFDGLKEIKQKAQEYWEQIWHSYTEVTEQTPGVDEPHELYISADDVVSYFDTSPSAIMLEPLTTDEASKITIQSASDIFIESRQDKSPIAALVNKLEELRRKNTVVVVSATEGHAERFRDILEEHDVPVSIIITADMTGLLFSAGQDHRLPVLITSGNLSSGFYHAETSLVIATEEELFGKRVRRRPPPKQKSRSFITSFQDIKPGDYVVHTAHGVGQYNGLTRRVFSGKEADFLCVRYAGGDSIYVPVDNMDLVQKYIGLEDSHPQVDSLKSSKWEKTKKRVRKAVEEIAAELVDLYAAREIMSGFAFSPDNYVLHEFESSFEFEETPDQQRAIEDVKRDMESKKPMDRLVCGDVGYGKTEVALRASCKAVMDGRQVAMLVPTTLLAHQHFQTFTQRFVSFPVRVEMLSRFRTSREQKEIIRSLAEGTVDIIIGTQRLLQKDVSFRNLGLVIVDEEQRFGVSQKEHLKELRKTIDVLTLSATPIPRTLQMGLYGIRDLSIIETPPVDRLAIRTIITPFDKRIIRDAVLREFSRGGQVFFVHNRVENIDEMASFLQDLLPEASIGIAHGQMREGLLENVINKFINGENNLLVCSAIVESGLDIPSANTIIINRADKFGLADLYQLRGRVGRSGHQAFAYLMIPAEESLSPDAKKRVRAIQELSDLGAGFRLAMKDLEIRGAGNLLGKLQSGNIMAVGFELYSQMLEQAVKKMRGEETEEEFNPAINLSISAYIPEEYIPDASQRLSFYKRLASAGEEKALSEMKEEMMDRYSALPQPVENLFKIIEIKILARSSMIQKIESSPGGLCFTVHPKSDIRRNLLSLLIRTYGKRVQFISEYTFRLHPSSDKPESPISDAINCLKALGGCD